MQKMVSIKKRNTTLLATGTLTAMASASIVATLPEIAKTFESLPAAEPLIKNLLGVHTLSIVLFSPIFGRLFDRYNKMALLAISVIIFGVSGASAAVLSSLSLLLASRVLVGVGVAGIRVGILTLMGEYFEGSRLDRFAGLQSAAIGVGATVFYTLGGTLADISWRYSFIVYAVALALVPAIFIHIRQAEHTPKQEDRGSAVPALGVRSEIHLLYACSFFGMLCCFVIPVQLPFHMNRLGMSMAQVGITNSAMVGVSVASALLFGHIRKKFTNKAIFLGFLFVVASSFLGLALSTNFMHILMVMAVHGLGYGLLLPNAHSWLLAIVPQDKKGKYSANLTICFLLGQSLSAPFSQVITTRYSISACFGIIGGLMLLATLLMSIISRKIYLRTQD